MMKKKEAGSGEQLEDQGSNNKKRSARAAAIESYASEANSEGDAVSNAVMAGILRRRKKKKLKKLKEQADAVHKSQLLPPKPMLPRSFGVKALRIKKKPATRWS